jgi:hypothetical protein
MSENIHPGSVEFERLEQELYALIEVVGGTWLLPPNSKTWELAAAFSS